MKKCKLNARKQINLIKASRKISRADRPAQNIKYGHSLNYFMANRWGNNKNSDRLYFHGLQNHCRWWLQLWNQKMLAPGRKAMTNLNSILKGIDITLLTKVHLVKAKTFRVVMYGCELDQKGRWALKNWCFWTVVLEKTLESPLDCKEIQPVHSEGDQNGFLGFLWKEWC